MMCEGYTKTQVDDSIPESPASAAFSDRNESKNKFVSSALLAQSLVELRMFVLFDLYSRKKNILRTL